MIPARRAIFSAIIGIAITIALAWIAMFIPHGAHGYGPPVLEEIGLTKDSAKHRIWQVDRGRNAWHTVVSYWHMQVSGQSLMIPIADYEARAIDLETLPDHFRPDTVDDLHIMAWYRATGFPFRALSCSVHWNTQISNADIIYDVHGGFQLPRDADFEPRALPLTPLWPGFALDVLIWGGAWFLLISGVIGARRAVRRRRNRCTHCGYSRRGLAHDGVCPECGRR